MLRNTSQYFAVLFYNTLPYFAALYNTCLQTLFVYDTLQHFTILNTTLEISRISHFTNCTHLYTTVHKITKPFKQSYNTLHNLFFHNFTKTLQTFYKTNQSLHNLTKLYTTLHNFRHVYKNYTKPYNTVQHFTQLYTIVHNST